MILSLKLRALPNSFAEQKQTNLTNLFVSYHVHSNSSKSTSVKSTNYFDFSSDFVIVNWPEFKLLKFGLRSIIN